MRYHLVLAAVLSVGLAGPGATNTGLGGERDIVNGLVSVAVADQIRKACPSISARMFKALSYVKGLESTAERRGYSRAEIDAWTSNRAEKNRLKGMARNYMAENGVVAGNANTYCALGTAEISRKSQIGQLLRAR